MSKAFNIATNLGAYQSAFDSSGDLTAPNITTDSVTTNSVTTDSINAANNVNVGNINVSSSNHTWTLKGTDAPIGDSQTGTAPDTTDNDSGQLAIYNGATKLWGITEGGWVQNPNAPSFSVGMVGYPSDANDSIVTNYNQIYHNIGGYLDTTAGRFTAPIDGRYFFSFHAFCQAGGNIDGGLFFRVNGSNTRRLYSSEPSDYRPWSIISVIQLSVGDYVEVYTQLNLHDNASNYFSGHLLG